jgi:hypothetical protein
MAVKVSAGWRTLQVKSAFIPGIPNQLTLVLTMTSVSFTGRREASAVLGKALQLQMARVRQTQADAPHRCHGFVAFPPRILGPHPRTGRFLQRLTSRAK